MKAVVLAAGVGSRLGSVTELVPKCMLELGGRPILEHNVSKLVASGITEIAINLHHLPDVVTGHFGDGLAFGARIRWAYEHELLGTAGTIASLRKWIDGDSLLVVYGDNIHGAVLPKLFAAHSSHHGAATVALFEREDVSASGVAELADSGLVTRFVEKPRPGETESLLVNAGLIVLEPQATDLVPARGDLSRDVLPQLAAAGLLWSYVMGPAETLTWVDTLSDLERATATYGTGELGPARIRT